PPRSPRDMTFGCPPRPPRSPLAWANNISTTGHPSLGLSDCTGYLATFPDTTRPSMKPRFWRQWHRWIGFPAAIFLIFAAFTGVGVAITEFFGEEEQLREATRNLVSPVTDASPPDAWSAPIARAMATAARMSPNSPVDKIEVQFKGPAPTVTVFTGKPKGGEDRKLVFSATSGELVSNETYADKPFIYRLHSGEAFG